VLGPSELNKSYRTDTACRQSSGKIMKNLLEYQIIVDLFLRLRRSSHPSLIIAHHTWLLTGRYEGVWHGGHVFTA